MWLPSATAVDQSIAPAAVRRRRSSACSAANTPEPNVSQKFSRNGKLLAQRLGRDLVGLRVGLHDAFFRGRLLVGPTRGGTSRSLGGSRVAAAPLGVADHLA